MSRNLADTTCAGCRWGDVRLVETPRPITEAEAGCYFPEYEGMVVANAQCLLCEAKYLAWVDEATKLRRHGYERRPVDGPFVDLSWRSTFNDEPGADDLPAFDVDRPPPARTGPYSGFLLVYAKP